MHAIGKNKRLKFNQRIYLFTTFTILIFSALLLASAIAMLQVLANRASIHTEQSRIDQDADGLSKNFEVYKNLAYAISISAATQDFLYSTKGTDQGYYEKLEAAKDNIKNICIANSNINFITIIPKQGDGYIFTSTQYSLKTIDPLEIYTKDIKNSHPFCQGNFRISFSNAYFPQYGPYLNVYFPLYSTKTINQVLGYLCFSINDKTLTNISKAGSDSLLLSQQGETITSDPSVYYPQMNQFTNRSGYVTSNGRFYFYTQVPDSTLILVHSIPTGSITRKLPQIAMPLTLLILILLAICLALLKPVIKHAYAPMSALLKAMQEVTTNRNISHRIDCDTFGADFSKIAQGFNAMMEEINSLILQVQEEQKTKEKLRYYMLQSQIKPHFLYNTLECIHWQALADGNKKISKLVLALGSYYKISLSKGAEIISLREELELVRNYLVIQNMRYGNIIENKIEIDEEYLALPIPKITLQPLVENAIYHGIRAKSGNKGSVAITICRQAPFYCLYITDSGSGEANKPAKQLNELLTKENPNAGYGIYNVNKRLQLYYGKTCGLHFIDNSMGGLTVEIKLTWLKTKGEPYV